VVQAAAPAGGAELLAAFSGQALLGAFVLSEALAPPVALREPKRP
jgi:hypothetical protein